MWVDRIAVVRMLVEGERTGTRELSPPFAEMAIAWMSVPATATRMRQKVLVGRR